MQGVTLTIAAIASGLVFLLAPIYGLIVYIACFAWYPTYLSVPLGTIDFTLRRIVILAILAKVFWLTDLPHRFKLIWLDKIIVIYFIAQLVSGSTTTTSLRALIENRAGAAFDMVLPYFAVRMIIKDKQQYLTLLKAILIIAAPLAIIGFYESLTGINPFGFMRKYAAWTGPFGPLAEAPKVRFGFIRAKVTTQHPIMYGLFFGMFGPLCAGLLHNAKKNKTLYWIGLGLMGVGIFSSMSSGPLLAALLSVPFIAFYRWRKHSKPVVITIVAMCVLLEIMSNNRLYSIVGRFAMNPQTAWYRSRLIEVALFEGGMSGHWLTGFGFNTDPGWLAKKYDSRPTDIVNEYLLVLSRFGLIGFVPFVAMNLGAIKRLINAYKVSSLDSDKWLIWCLAAGLFGLAGAFVSVSIYDAPVTVYALMIGLCGAMPDIVTGRISSELVRIGTDLPYYGKSILSVNNSRLG